MGQIKIYDLLSSPCYINKGDLFYYLTYNP